MKPSELTEGQWIKITGEHKKKRKRASIGFHVEYSQLSCFSLHPDCNAEDAVQLEITNDPELADQIYAQYEHCPNVTIETGGGYYSHEDKTPRVVRQGEPVKD